MQADKVIQATDTARDITTPEEDSTATPIANSNMPAKPASGFTEDFVLKLLALVANKESYRSIR